MTEDYDFNEDVTEQVSILPDRLRKTSFRIVLPSDEAREFMNMAALHDMSVFDAIREAMRQYRFEQPLTDAVSRARVVWHDKE